MFSKRLEVSPITILIFVSQLLHGMIVNIRNHCTFVTLNLLTSPYGLILANAVDHMQAKFTREVSRNSKGWSCDASYNRIWEFPI